MTKLNAIELKLLRVRTFYPKFFCWGWGYRIHQLLLSRGLKSPQRVSLYDTKQSDGEAPVMLELWGMWSTPLLPSLPGSIWPGVLAPDRVLSMDRIQLNWVLMLNWIAWNRTVLIFKLRIYAKLNWLKWNCFWHWNCTYTKLNCLK